MPAKKKQAEEAEVVGPFEDERYLSTYGVTLKPGETFTVPDDDGGK